MSKIVLCDKCGSSMIPYLKGYTCGYTCPKCGNGWATGYFTSIESDATIYDIIIDAVESPNIEQIRLISKLTNCNFIAARSLLATGGKIMSE